MIVFIETGVLGILCSPIKKSRESIECEEWLYTLLSRGIRVVTSEMCEYEVKRGLTIEKRAGKKTGIEILNELKAIIEFLPITGADLDVACELWADSIEKGIQVAPENDINIDIILCAQWENLVKENPGQEIIIASKNVRHLGRFAVVSTWEQIKPC
ncbi:type II toxin-antitoxin system VapC family toxin [Lusitaniella coriacea]|uniref:type II toxin-antitoxin system VapC family toxin n=1 Tax=Lusitaniella coriacea TaxID=1983105 RepID=UPI003CEB6B96